MRLLEKATAALPSRVRSILAKAAAVATKKTSGTKSRLFMVAVAIVGLGAAVSFATPPLSWLPEASEADSLLGPLLGAQAAITALTLAVTLFVMQGVSNRRDADDRIYREYVSRSRVRQIFWGSIAAVGLTAAVLLVEKFAGAAAPMAEATSGLRNLTLAAVGAFFGNLAFAVALFQTALHLAHPDQWRILRREVNERDVRDTVHAFLHRYQRAMAALEAGDLDSADAFPGPGEGSADEAIRALLDDARRAMGDQRQAEFEQSLDSIRGLVEYAMNQIEREGIEWAAPGARPQWPPLSGLSSNLYPFREAIIGEADREYAFALLKFDYWLLKTGVDRRCGELFTVGLEGYRHNYEIVGQTGNIGLVEIFRDRFWAVAWPSIIELSLREAFPYIVQMVRHQERLLSVAMHGNRAIDFERLQTGFDGFLRAIRLHWRVERWQRTESTELYEQLEQDYRVALMGLGGRALLLTELGRSDNPRPYVQGALSKYDEPGRMGSDIARALDESHQVTLWADWEMQGAEPLKVHSLERGRYPLTFFCVALLEFAATPLPPLDLKGSAQRVLDWFTANADGLERHVPPSLDITLDERRERAIGALHDAVRRDEVNADLEIAGWQLSPQKLAAFKADVYSSAIGANSIERLFERAEAFQYLTNDAIGAPSQRRFREFAPKAFLAEVPAHARIHYEPLRGNPLGQSLARDVVNSFCEALDEAPIVAARIDSSAELISAIDEALEDIGPSSEGIVFLRGDWSGYIGELAMQPPDGYEPTWSEAGWPVVVALYLGHTILFSGGDDGRQLYVVEPRAWGCFVRAQAEEERDLVVNVAAIDADRAKELLIQNPNHLPDLPDRASKLRRLQTFVEVRVVACTEFRVTDSSRARRVVSPDE